MFASPQLAARIDRAEGRLCADIARVANAPRAAVLEIGGGVAVFAGDGSPTNKMIGLGFDELPSGDELDHVERVFAERHAPLRAEISTLATPELHALLVRRGYVPLGFENLLGCALDDRDREMPPGIAIGPVAAGDRERWVDLVVDSFAVPDTGGIGGDAIPASEELRRWLSATMHLPGFVCVDARIGDQLAGGAAFRLDEGIAQLCGAATLPALRRRGVQTALLRWRLAYAATRGCTLAVVATQPASKSQQNVQRAGFTLLYARQLLVKAP